MTQHKLNHRGQSLKAGEGTAVLHCPGCQVMTEGKAVSGCGPEQVSKVWCEEESLLASQSPDTHASSGQFQLMLSRWNC